MKTHNPENERIKRRYMSYLKDARGRSEASLDQAAAAIHQFESYTKYRSFKAFHIEQAKGFKAYLAEQKNQRTGQNLSKATLYSTSRALKAFFVWLADQPGYRSKISYSDADYFNLSENETRVARARREQPVATLEQIIHVIEGMPASSDIERRNRALIAFTLLTGARDGAMASMKLKHVNLGDMCIIQDGREVNTKFGKTFATYFFPVGDDIKEIVVDWVTYLTKEKLWGLDDPIFPATHVSVGSEGGFQVDGLKRHPWSNASPIRKIFKASFEQAGLPYFNPHSFRNTLVQLGEQLCNGPEEFKAWSQNLGHERVMTTFSSYGAVSPSRQADLIRNISCAEQEPEGLKNIIAQLQEVERRNGAKACLRQPNLPGA